MTEVDQVRQDLRDLRADFGKQLDSVNGSLKQLAEATKELIRVDGDLKVLSEAVSRIGRESEDHEVRLRYLESRSGRLFDRLAEKALMIFIGGVLMFILTKTLGG